MVGILYLEDQGFSYPAKAQETISGGQIVKAVSGPNVLTSSSNFGNTAEVGLCNAVGDIAYATGVAIGTVVSGETIGIATAGVHGFYASSAVAAGEKVCADGTVATADCVAPFGASITSGAQVRFGYALTTAASGQLVAVRLG